MRKQKRFGTNLGMNLIMKKRCNEIAATKKELQHSAKRTRPSARDDRVSCKQKKELFYKSKLSRYDNSQKSLDHFVDTFLYQSIKHLASHSQILAP